MLVFSCVDFNNDLNTNYYKPTIVIEGLVLDSVGRSYVKLSLSAPSGDSINNTKIDNASVLIIENENIYDTFHLKSPGLYTDKDFIGKLYSNYTLIVVYNGQTFSAKSELLPVTTIDSLVYKVTDSLSENMLEYKVRAYAKRTFPDRNSFYKIKVYKNDSLFNGYSDLAILTDVYMESFEGFEIPINFKSADKFKIDIYSISQQVYNYYDELLELTLGNINAIYFYPQNPATNLSNGALGIFQVSSVSSKEIILP